MGFVRESFRLQLIGELPELVEVDTRPEPEGMRDRLRRRLTASRSGLPQAGADCPIDGFLEGDAKLPRAPLQQAC
jgi:hypothetical protein